MGGVALPPPFSSRKSFRYLINVVINSTQRFRFSDNAAHRRIVANIARQIVEIIPRRCEFDLIARTVYRAILLVTERMLTAAERETDRAAPGDWRNSDTGDR
jgi:hypothetical protein